MTSPLTVELYKAYADIDLNDDSPDTEIQSAIDAETTAQGNVCRLSDPYPADLFEALKRRVSRNLALRPMPIIRPRGDAESGVLYPPGRDPEIRRLEGPYRKVVIG